MTERPRLQKAKEGPLKRPVMYSKVPERAAPFGDVRESRMQFAENLLWAKAETRRYMSEHPDETKPPAFLMAQYRYADIRRTRRKVAHAHTIIRRWLDNHLADDVWGVHTRKVPDTWGEWEIYVQFWGTDPVEALERRKARREKYLAIRRGAAEKRRVKMLELQNQARDQEVP